jgi:hypothetical protein
MAPVNRIVLRYSRISLQVIEHSDGQTWAVARRRAELGGWPVRL